MSITKYSPDDVSKLSERIWRLEQDIKNLKMERKVYFSDAMKGKNWIEWIPSFGAEDPMTFVATSYAAEYCIIDGVVFFNMSATGVTGGTASPVIQFTVPTAVGYGGAGACRIHDPYAVPKAGTWSLETPTRIGVSIYDNSNYGIGADRNISVQGFYKEAE